MDPWFASRFRWENRTSKRLPKAWNFCATFSHYWGSICRREIRDRFIFSLSGPVSDTHVQSKKINLSRIWDDKRRDYWAGRSESESALEFVLRAPVSSLTAAANWVNSSPLELIASAKPA